MRFVGKLYRHYGIEGKTAMLTRDPLFLTHIQNADFENGLEGWTLATPRKRDPFRPKEFPDMAESRDDTWDWDVRPIRSISATPFCG